MKNTGIILAATAGVLFFLIGATSGKDKKNYTSMQEQSFTFPEEIMAIIDNKCNECHSLKGESEEARDVLMWNDLPGLSKARQIATLDAVIETLNTGTMPPKDEIQRNPDAQLTNKELNLLRDWAESTADNLLK